VIGHQDATIQIRAFKPSTCPIRRQRGNALTVSCDELLESEDHSRGALSLPTGKSKR